MDIKRINIASRFIKNGDFNSAEKIYAGLLRDYPDNEVVLSFWGYCKLKEGQFDKAEKILERAYKIRKSAATIAALAYTKFHNGIFDDAIILYEELFQYDKDSPKIFSKIIFCFKRLEMYEFAHAYCLKFLSKYPDDEDALCLMTQSYMDLGDYSKAEEYCKKIMELYPDNPANWIHSGLLQELKYCNDDVAQECYKIAIQNGGVDAYYHLAVSYAKVGKNEEAYKYFQKCIEKHVNKDIVATSLGMFLLRLRDFENGYKNFVLREPSGEIKSLKNRWFGQDDRLFSKNKTVLVYCDQGFGDAIQFIRYVPFLQDKFAKVIVYARQSLIDLFSKNFRGINFVCANLSAQDYDVSVVISDLPYYLSMDFNCVPSNDKYIMADKHLIEEYCKKYFDNNKLKIGLCWKSGGMGIRAAINRTINIDYFKPLFDINNVEFYSFQKDDIFDGCKKYPNLIDLGSTFKNFDDTAAALNNVDLLITADTAIVHLAGAMGKSSILLIPYCPDWRWFDNDETTEWYSSVKIIKQKDHQDWYIEVDKVKEIINKLIN